jgi:flavorubredoxin
MDFKVGDTTIKALPAHFLHSVGNFHFYDTTSKILFSGDVGASLVAYDADRAVDDFKKHIPTMLGFHKRYMVSNKVLRLWVDMVRTLDVEMIIPQHGRPFVGKEMIDQFLEWLEGLECGIDNLSKNQYSLLW